MQWLVQTSVQWLVQPGRRSSLCASPRILSIDVELDEFDGSVPGKLPDHRESRDECAGCNEYAIVVAALDEPRHVIETSGESFHNSQQFKCVEISCRGLAVGTPFGAELPVKILEER